MRKILNFICQSEAALLLYDNFWANIAWGIYIFNNSFVYSISSATSGPKCDQSQSQLTPEAGGTVDFTTPPGKTIQARSILISMIKIHTVAPEPNPFPDNDIVLKQYFYSISDINVSGKCFCNGHAEQCDLMDPKTKVCVCQHNTDGPNCNTCLRFYHNRPWQELKGLESDFECERCNCNGQSAECRFDQGVYERNGRSNGGVCEGCQNNATGQNCEKCLPDFYMNKEGKCDRCDCNMQGSQQSQCDDDGLCKCKPGVTGPLCDQCIPGYYGFGSQEGCSKCECNTAGTRASITDCNPIDGSCPCKTNVHGQTCSQCKEGFFGLSSENENGCQACFCYGHSTNCSKSDERMTMKTVESDLTEIG